MLVNLRRAILISLVFIGLTFAYAYAGTGLSQLFFSHQANGSITPNGSTLVGQNWTSSRWFHGRPDDAGPYHTDEKAKPPVPGGDNPLVANGVSGNSGASNLGPRSKTLLQNTEQLVKYWHARGVDPTPDLVTTSGSGYDPDISPQDATVQIPMVSRATGISPSRLKALIASQSQGAELGFLGSSYVNVLNLNLALARLR